jgi:hypothetical protein
VIALNAYSIGRKLVSNYCITLMEVEVRSCRVQEVSEHRAGRIWANQPT